MTVAPISFTYQGGLSDGYKKHIAETEIPDVTYTEDGLALFRVQGSGPENMQAIQVEPVSPTDGFPPNFLTHFFRIDVVFLAPTVLLSVPFFGISRYFVISHELNILSFFIYLL